MRIFGLVLLGVCTLGWGQTSVNPLIKGYGTVFEAPDADLKPDPHLEYKILIDLVSSDQDRSQVSFSVNQIARLLNLHVMGGVPKENLEAVVAVHGGAIWTVLNQEVYANKFGVQNPHEGIYKEFLDNGVKVVVCSQTLYKHGLAPQDLLPGLEIATSALTTLSMYQLMGYALFQF